MSRKDEDRIIHGLHYYRESLDEEFEVDGEQILWLAANSFNDGSGWYRDGEFKSFDSSVLPDELRRKLLVSKFELPLRYLQYRRLIKLTTIDEERVRIAVTFAGADRAMRLHTRTGRLEVWYQEPKDGFVGILTTVAVSLVTALTAMYVVGRLEHGSTDAPRLIYEVVPKSQP